MNTNWMNFENVERQQFRYEGEIGSKNINRLNKNQNVVEFTFFNEELALDIGGSFVILKSENFTQE